MLRFRSARTVVQVYTGNLPLTASFAQRKGSSLQLRMNGCFRASSFAGCMPLHDTAWETISEANMMRKPDVCLFTGTLHARHRCERCTLHMPVVYDDAIDGRIPLWHECPKVVQVPVARVYAGEIGKSMQACQILHSSGLLPKLPA